LRAAQRAVGLRGEVSVLLAGDRTLRRLNREYRGKRQGDGCAEFSAPAEEMAGVHGGRSRDFAGDGEATGTEHAHTPAR
jgi:hypothetical protein